MVWTENIFLNIFGVLLATVVAVIAFFKWKFNYWKNLGVDYQEPTFPFGNLGNTLLKKVSIGETIGDLYLHFKSKKAIHGGVYFLCSPAYMPVDLDLLKRVMVADFAHFMDHGGYINEKDDPLSAHLFSLGGQKWRDLRVKLTPTFTSGKMKNMFPIMVQISQEFVAVLSKECEESSTVEVKDILARFGTDIIGNCAFGIECNSLQDPNTEFRIQGRKMSVLTIQQLLVNFFSSVAPDLMRSFGIRQYPKSSTDFFINIVRSTMEYREQNDFRRNDFLQLLLDLKSKDGEKDDALLTFNEIAAQAFIFFMGGYETSSSLMSFALLELAANEDIQDKLRHEITSTLKKHNDDFTYEAMMDMRYMDMVVNETLRKYPPLSVLPRLCTKDYHVPNTDVVIKKDHIALISIRGIHHDPENYPNPDIFDPTRFNEENKSERHPFAFIPFGEGPRICIGLRFGLMQTKVGLTAILKNFKVKMDDRTEYPAKLDPKCFGTGALGGLWLHFEKLS